MQPLIIQSDSGLYCVAGDFFIDPWRPVDRAVLTHAHSDHARAGSGVYLVSRAGERIFRHRLGEESRIETIDYGEERVINGVRVSLHPAGHILGSAQVRVEYRGQVWVASGDYKLTPDATCAPFAPIRCHAFITEATFGLPIYRWPEPPAVFDEINTWWRANQKAGRASLLLAYSLGKAQRIMKGVDATIGPIYTHGAVEHLTAEYRASGVDLPPTEPVSELPKKTDWSRALILAPPSADGSPWARKFGTRSTAFASGWMAIRGTRRRRALDRGFVLSDHADWEELLTAIRAGRAEQVWVTHGYVPVLARYLREQTGLDARELKTSYVGEGGTEEE